MAFGITPQGFVLKRLEDIKGEIEQDLRDALGENINLLPEEVLGQIVGVISERLSLIWEQMQAIYNSQYPDDSEDINLDNVASITGVIRRTPSKSTVEGQLLFGTPGTIITNSSIVSVLGSSLSRFLTIGGDVLLVAGTDEIQDVDFDITPTSGDFKLNFRGIASAAIDFDDTASEVQTKLEAMSSIGVGNVTVTGAITSAAGLTITFITDTAGGLGKRDTCMA